MHIDNGRRLIHAHQWIPIEIRLSCGAAFNRDFLKPRRADAIQQGALYLRFSAAEIDDRTGVDGGSKLIDFEVARLRNRDIRNNGKVCRGSECRDGEQRRDDEAGC